MYAEDLEIIYQPCNQFGWQEPLYGQALRDDIDNYFIKNNFNTDYSNQVWLERNDVKGKQATELFKILNKEMPKDSWFFSSISWNFEKFVVVNGEPGQRYGSSDNLLEDQLDDIKNFVSQLPKNSRKTSATARRRV